MQAESSQLCLMALIIDMKWDCDLCVYQVCNIFSWSQPSKLISIPIYSKIYQSYVLTNLLRKSMNLILQNDLSEHKSTPDNKHQIVFFITKPFQVKLYLIL